MLFSVASEKIMNLHGGIFFDRHKSDFIIQKRTIKYIILHIKNCVFFGEFLRKNVGFFEKSGKQTHGGILLYDCIISYESVENPCQKNQNNFPKNLKNTLNRRNSARIFYVFAIFCAEIFF